MLYEGVPAFFRSDNDGEMAAKVLRHRLSGHDEELTHHARIILEERCGCFNRKPRSESLNGATFYSLREVKEVIEQRRIHYNTRRPHSVLGFRPSAPVSIAPLQVHPTSDKQAGLSIGHYTPMRSDEPRYEGYRPGP